MSPKSDDDLLEVFSHARRRDREDVPAWRPELLEEAPQRRGLTWRWALVAASVGVLVVQVFFTPLPQREPTLSEALPPLFDSPPGELFAGLQPSLLSFEAPSDFLLPDQLNSTDP